jgi:hypothetical protein
MPQSNPDCERSPIKYSITMNSIKSVELQVVGDQRVHRCSLGFTFPHLPDKFIWYTVESFTTKTQWHSLLASNTRYIYWTWRWVVLQIVLSYWPALARDNYRNDNIVSHDNYRRYRYRIALSFYREHPYFYHWFLGGFNGAWQPWWDIANTLLAEVMSEWECWNIPVAEIMISWDHVHTYSYTWLSLLVS